MIRQKGWEKLNLDRDGLLQMYRESGSIERLAVRIGVTSRTIRFWLRELGIRGKRYWVRDYARREASNTLISKWIKTHPHAKLPHSAKAIAELTGINPSTVGSYLTRRARRVRAYALSFGDLRKLKIVVRDEAGRMIPTRAIREYSLRVDRYSLEVTAEGSLPGTVFCLRVPLKTYKSWFERKEEPSSPTPLASPPTRPSGSTT